MVQIANISRLVQRFTDTKGAVVEVEPGTSQNVDIDKDDPRVEAKRNARLIQVGGTEKQAAKAAREKAPALIDPAPKADEPAA